MKILFLVFVQLISITLHGQEKRICKKKISSAIQEFIKTNYPNAGKIKYFQEKENETTFVESVFLHNQREYTLKFLGDSLVEVELTIKFEDIPNEVQQKIKNSLDSLFGQYKIIKTQEVNPQHNLMYEVNIKTKSNDYFELFYDEQGNLTKKSQLIIKPINSLF